MDLTWRPLTLADAKPLAQVFAAAEAVDPTGEHYSEEDLREAFEGPSISLVDAATAVGDGDRLVGYALVRRRDAANPEHKVRIEGLVHPDYRDDAIGADLVAWFVRAGKLVHERTFPGAPLELYGHAHESQRWYAGVLETGGFHVARSFVDMRVDLGELPPAQPSVPRRTRSTRSARTRRPRPRPAKAGETTDRAGSPCHR